MAVSVGAVAGSTRVIGDYEIVRPLADRGGMAVVYVARQSRLDRIVALKEVDLRGGAEFVDRFVREARLAGSLNHPNVVTVFDFFERESVPYIAMEYLPQGSLRRQMRGLGLPQILGVLQGMLAGLDHAHGRGLVHRDVKPENVLVTDAGTVKVADFGLAFAYANASNRLTRTGAVMGTATYMSPEQAQNLPVGPRTDLYAVGVTAYEMLLGRPPFEPGQHPMALMAQHVSVPVPDPVALRPDLDPRIAAWLMRLLAKEPSARPASAVAAWEELEESAVRILGPMWRRSARLDAAIADEPAAPLAPPVFEAARDEPSAGRPPDRDETATPGLRPSKTLAPPRRRRRFVAAAGTLLLLLGAAGGAYGLSRVGTPRQAAVTGATGTPAENPVTRVTPAATATLAATATPAATDTPPPTATSASKTGADPGDTLLRGVPAGLRSMCQPPEAGGGSNAGPLPPGVTALAGVRCRGTGELRDLTAGVVEYFLLPSKGAPGRWLDLDARTFADGGRDAPHRPAAGACERFTGAGTWDERDWPRGRALCLWDDEETQTIEWTAPEDHILARLVSVRPQTPVWRAQEQAAG